MQSNKSKIAKVFVIDQEPIIGDAIKAALENVGHSVKAVQSEAEAIAALKEPFGSAQDKPFDVVFIHRGLPASVCDEIVKAARLSGNPAIILMSSEKSEAVEKNKLRLGADEIIYKPLNPFEIRAIVERCLDKSHPLEVPGSPHILVVDDDEIVLSSVKDVLKDSYDVTGTNSPKEALQILKDKSYEIVLVDLMMDEMHGMDFIHSAKILRPSILAIVITGYASKDAAVEALRGGAYDFLEKPLTPKIVLQTVGRAWKALRTELENRRLLKELHNMNLKLQKYASEMEQLADERAQQLVHADRMVTLGTFSAGIAHEINNPICIITANVQILEKLWNRHLKAAIEKVQKESAGKNWSFVLNEIPEMFKALKDSAWRTSKIVSNLKNFSRKEEASFEQANICECIENAVRLCRLETSFKHTVKIKLDLPDNVPNTILISLEIEQVFINLITNASHSMEKMDGEKKITLTASVNHNESEITIKISDNGFGMDKKTLNRIFEPFFTTKELGKGTGLGLSICHGIIKKHRGTITAQSTPGEGTTFTVKLPFDPQKKERRQSVVEKIIGGRRKEDETILD